MNTVRSWMCSPAISAHDTMTLAQARHLMRERRVQCMPVVDALERLVGVVTDGDLSRWATVQTATQGRQRPPSAAPDLPLRHVMTRAVITVTPDTPLRDVARLLFQYRIGCLPVLEAGRLVGLISEQDLFRRMTALALHEAEPWKTSIAAD